MKTVLLTAIAVMLYTVGLAQPNYKKASIITNDGTQIQGWINYREWSENPSLISFKTKKEANEAKEYVIVDLKQFEIENMECYERSVVSLSMNPQNIEDLNVGPDIQYRQDTVWLNLLQKGKHVDLYKYTDAIKTRFYIKEKGTEIPVELVYHKYLNPKDNTKIIGLEQYKNQLANIASRYKEINTAELANLLPLTPYQQRSMEEIADFINKGTAQHFPATKIKPWHFYAGLAFSASKASYGGDHELAVGATNKMSYSPKLCFGIDIFSNPLVGKILFRFDLSFSMANYEIRKEKPNVLKIEQTFRQVTESLTTTSDL